jgi:uncharacterized DUF497 family protein
VAISGVAFEWDRRKNSSNLRKHRVGFAEASSVFDDPLSITIPDPDHSADEERWVIIGISSKRSLRVVVRIRLISARSATKREKRHYEEGESIQ